MRIKSPCLRTGMSSPARVLKRSTLPQSFDTTHHWHSFQTHCFPVRKHTEVDFPEGDPIFNTKCWRSINDNWRKQLLGVRELDGCAALNVSVKMAQWKIAIGPIWQLWTTRDSCIVSRILDETSTPLVQPSVIIARHDGGVATPMSSLTSINEKPSLLPP